MGEPRYTKPETLEGLVHHLRVMSDRALEQIDADRLLRAADTITALRTIIADLTATYPLTLSEAQAPALMRPAMHRLNARTQPPPWRCMPAR